MNPRDDKWEGSPEYLLWDEWMAEGRFVDERDQWLHDRLKVFSTRSHVAPSDDRFIMLHSDGTSTPSTIEEKAFSVLEAYGVPRERAKNVPNGIQVLVSRMDKERDALHANLSSIISALQFLDEGTGPNTAVDLAIKAAMEIKRLRSMPSATGPSWIPVSEMMPEKDSHFVLVFETSGECSYTAYRREGRWFHACGGYEVGRVTHWMPLPSAPADGGDKTP